MTTFKLASPMLTALVLAVAPSHAAPILGAELESFAVLGAAAVTNTGATQLVGSLGVSNNSSASGITGFLGTLANDGPGTASGAVHQGSAFAILADGQLDVAKASLSLMGPGTVLGTDLVGLTLTPGVYTVGASTSNLTGALTLDGLGNANAVWVFQMPSTLITSAGAAVNVVNTGSGAGVFWNVGSSATLGANTTFEGNILASASISMGTGVSLSCGRALAHTGAVTLISDAINAGSCIGTGEEGSKGLSGGLSVPPGTTGSGGTGGGTGAPALPVPLPFAPLSPIPEPEAWALMLAGLLVLLMTPRGAVGVRGFWGRIRPSTPIASFQ